MAVSIDVIGVDMSLFGDVSMLLVFAFFLLTWTWQATQLPSAMQKCEPLRRLLD